MADQVSRTIAWLKGRIEAAHQDSDAHPKGSNNRLFYFAQAVAYENALSALQNGGHLLSAPSDTKESAGVAGREATHG